MTDIKLMKGQGGIESYQYVCTDDGHEGYLYRGSDEVERLVTNPPSEGYVGPSLNMCKLLFKGFIEEYKGQEKIIKLFN